MRLLDHLRWAIAPDQRRSLWLLYGGMGAFLALGALATLLQVPRPMLGVMGLAMLAAWIAAACGVVGYFRWFFGVEVGEQRRDAQGRR